MNDMYSKLFHEVLDLLHQERDLHVLSKDEQKRRVGALVDRVSERNQTYLGSDAQQALVDDICARHVYAYRSLQRVIDDPHTEEIMVNPQGAVFIKQHMHPQFMQLPQIISATEVHEIIEKMLEGSGRRVDRKNPSVDVHLPQARANIIVPPLSPHGPTITVRKFPAVPYALSALLEKNLFDGPTYAFLKEAIALRLNILVSGGTAAGKTTLLSAMLSSIADSSPASRLVIVEETAEIKVSEKLANTVFLESVQQGAAEHTGIRALVKNALRMRPDRLVIGEVRGGEAFDLLQAMNTGHPGSICTIHANSAADSLTRLEALVHLAHFSDLNSETIRSWIMRALDLVIFVAQTESGRRITEILGIYEGRKIPLFTFKKGKLLPHKKELGVFIAYQKSKAR